MQHNMAIVVAFNLPALLVLLLYFLWGGGPTEYAMGGVLVLYFVGTVVIARRSGETIRNALKDNFLAEQRRVQLETNDRTLTREIEARRQSERQLTDTLSQNRKFNEALDALHNSYILGDQSTERLTSESTKCIADALKIERVSVWVYSEDDGSLECKDLYEASSNSHSAGLLHSRDDYPDYFDALAESRVINVPDAKHDPRTACFTETYLNPARHKITSGCACSFRTRPLGRRLLRIRWRKAKMDCGRNRLRQRCCATDFRKSFFRRSPESGAEIKIGACRRRARKRGENRFPRHDESRNSHAHERRSRGRRLVAKNAS